jgi:hypothetical protein
MAKWLMNRCSHAGVLLGVHWAYNLYRPSHHPMLPLLWFLMPIVLLGLPLPLGQLGGEG